MDEITAPAGSVVYQRCHQHFTGTPTKVAPLWVQNEFLSAVWFLKIHQSGFLLTHLCVIPSNISSFIMRGSEKNTCIKSSLCHWVKATASLDCWRLHIQFGTKPPYCGLLGSFSVKVLGWQPTRNSYNRTRTGMEWDSAGTCGPLAA